MLRPDQAVERNLGNRHHRGGRALRRGRAARPAAHRKDAPDNPAATARTEIRTQRPRIQGLTGCISGVTPRRFCQTWSQAATVSAASGPRSKTSRFCSSCGIFDAPRITQSVAVWNSSQLSARSIIERPACLRDFLQLVDGIEVGRVPVAVEIHLVGVEAGAGERPLAVLLSGKQAAGERVVDDRRNAELFAEGEVFLLDAARQQVVHGLRNVGCRIALLLRDPQRLLHLPRGEIRSGRVAHLAGLHHLVHGLEALLDRGFVIRQVEVVEIQVVGLQTAQTLRRCRQGSLCRRAAKHRAGPRLSSRPCSRARDRSRRPLRMLPRMTSDWPLLYALAVSKKLMPRSIQMSTMRAPVGSSVCPPKVIAPKQARETVRSV